MFEETHTEFIHSGNYDQGKNSLIFYPATRTANIGHSTVAADVYK